MKTELTYSDITEDLCRHCAKCCTVYIPIELDERTLEFYRNTGLDIEIDPQHPNIGIINAGACQHLNCTDNLYSCDIYNTRPKLCKDYNCVAWAKFSGLESEIAQHALGVYNRLAYDIIP